MLLRMFYSMKTRKGTYWKFFFLNKAGMKRWFSWDPPLLSRRIVASEKSAIYNLKRMWTQSRLAFDAVNGKLLIDISVKGAGMVRMISWMNPTLSITSIFCRRSREDECLVTWPSHFTETKRYVQTVVALKMWQQRVLSENGHHRCMQKITLCYACGEGDMRIIAEKLGPSYQRLLTLVWHSFPWHSWIAEGFNKFFRFLAGFSSFKSVHGVRCSFTLLLFTVK